MGFSITVKNVGNDALISTLKRFEELKNFFDVVQPSEIPYENYSAFQIFGLMYYSCFATTPDNQNDLYLSQLLDAAIAYLYISDCKKALHLQNIRAEHFTKYQIVSQ